MYIPTSNPSESTLIKETRLPEGKTMPRENWKGMKRVPENLRIWAVNKESHATGQGNGSDDYFKGKMWTGLNNQEHKLLWHHFNSLGLSDEQIDIEIENIKNQIKKAHEEHKKGIRDEPNFKEEFDKLVAK